MLLLGYHTMTLDRRGWEAMGMMGGRLSCHKGSYGLNNMEIIGEKLKLRLGTWQIIWHKYLIVFAADKVML